MQLFNGCDDGGSSLRGEGGSNRFFDPDKNPMPGSNPNPINRSPLPSPVLAGWVAIDIAPQTSSVLLCRTIMGNPGI